MLGLAARAGAAEERVASPDGTLELVVRTGKELRWDLTRAGVPILRDTAISLRIDGRSHGTRPRVVGTRRAHVATTITPPVRYQAASLREAYEELRVELEGGVAVTFRAYDEGVAYRFETTLARPEVTVEAEVLTVRCAGACAGHLPAEPGFFSPNEPRYVDERLRKVPRRVLLSTPVLLESAGVRVAIADADVASYPGLWFRGTGADALTATFPPIPGTRQLARTAGTRTYPWRVFAVAATDAALITNPLVTLLARPSEIADTSWIRPGKAAWDWWTATRLWGVPFAAGFDTRTYEHYVDFAARHGLGYVLLDEGWSAKGDPSRPVPALDVARVVATARARGVGVILWVRWDELAARRDAILDQYAAWGVRGIKVDYMYRDDQPMMDFVAGVARAAAARRMIVDFHGAMRPAQLMRTFPNVLTVEGARGLEHCKSTPECDPEHLLTLPFTRGLLGAFDVTPGSTRNATRDDFAPVWALPMNLGTRCQQLAELIVFASPLQVLADSPSAYDREPDAMAFLAAVPTTWDETRVLEARYGDVVVIARRSGKVWWIGALTDWTPRELAVDLTFLGASAYTLDAWADGANAARHAADFTRAQRPVDRTTRLTLKLAPGGGFAARIAPSER